MDVAAGIRADIVLDAADGLDLSLDVGAEPLGLLHHLGRLTRVLLDVEM